MSLGQVLVFADEENDVIPKILVEVSSYAIPDTFGFANVDRSLPRLRIGTTQEIDA